MNGDVFPPGTKPAVMPRESLVALLYGLIDMIKEDDSMEGSLIYEWGNEQPNYNVSCFLRTGNSMGQGGAIVIGENEPVPVVVGHCAPYDQGPCSCGGNSGDLLEGE